MKNALLSLLFLPVHFLFPQSPSWQNLEFEGEPQARHENALGVVDDHLVLIGGRGDKKIDIYSFSENKWTKGAKPPFEIHHMQAVTLDGLIYILGGFTGSWPYETPLTHVLIYDITEDTWATGPEIPAGRRRGAAGAVSYNNKIYLVNGIINGHTSGWVNWLDEFDPYTNSWKELPTAPQARDHFQGAVIGDHLYVAGGRRSGSGETGFSGTVKEAARYNFITGEWEELPGIPTERAGTAAAVYNNNFVVLGGESDTQEISHKEVEMFNLLSNSWEQLPELQTGRHGTQAVTLEKMIITGAGSGNRGGGPELTSFEIFTAEADKKPDISTEALEPGELKTSAKVISYNSEPDQKIGITNTSPNKAMFISYIQLDNTSGFTLTLPRQAPLILAPGETITAHIKRLGNGGKVSSSNLIIKRLGNSEPVQVPILN